MNMVHAEPLPIESMPLFKSVSTYDLSSSQVCGDLEVPMLVGESAVFLEQLSPTQCTLYRWEACHGTPKTLREHEGRARCSFGHNGATVLVLLDGYSEELSLLPLPGRVLLITAKGAAVEIARKAPGEPCPGGDSLGWKTSFADFDAEGRVALALSDRVVVYSAEGEKIAEKSWPDISVPSLVGWHHGAVTWDEHTEASRYRCWNPDTGMECTRKRLLWKRPSIGGATRQGAAGRGPWPMGRSRLLTWRGAYGREHRYTTLERYGFWQWFAGEYILCFGNGAPALAVDTRSGRGQYCFPEGAGIDVLVASPTAMKLLALRSGQVSVADSSDLNEHP